MVSVISAKDRATKGSGLKLLVNHIWHFYDTGNHSPTRVFSLRWTCIILIAMPTSSGAKTLSRKLDNHRQAFNTLSVVGLIKKGTNRLPNNVLTNHYFEC